MAKIPTFNPLSGEARSPLIAGLTEVANKVSDALNMQSEEFENVPMSEVFIDDDDRYRIYEVDIGKKLWLSDPKPIIRKNGSIINSAVDNFTVDLIGGSVAFEPTNRLLETDNLTATFTSVKAESQKLYDIQQTLIEIQTKLAKDKGYYESPTELRVAYPTATDGDYAVVGTTDTMWVWDNDTTDWKDTFKATDLTNYYDKATVDNFLGQKEPTLNAKGEATADDNFYYGGRKQWIDLFAKVRNTLLTGVDLTAQGKVEEIDNVIIALGKLQSQINSNDTNIDDLQTQMVSKSKDIDNLQTGKADKIIYGETTETGSGEKSPDNPYVLSGVDVLGTTLYSLPNGVRDEGNTVSGKFTKRVEKLVVNGSEGWRVQRSADGKDIINTAFAYNNKKIKDRSEPISDKFVGYGNAANLWDGDIQGISSGNANNPNVLIIKINRNYLDENSALESFEQKFSENPVTVLYELETPEIITKGLSTNDLTDELKSKYDDYDTNKEPKIVTKNTAFNKNFGTTVGTVAEGDKASYATNLLNGNATGALRSINSKSDYTMGESAFAEGNQTIASSYYAHAEGDNTMASAQSSHAEGNKTIASQLGAHSEGSNTRASALYSHAEGNHTTAEVYALHTQGQYNKINAGSIVLFNTSQNAFVIGNGNDSSTLSNAFRVDYGGGVFGNGAFHTTGADYSESYEWFDGNSNNEDRVARFVTADGDKIKIANASDDYILGVVSATPSVVGDSYDDQWQGQYLTDIFGRPLTEKKSRVENEIVGYDENSEPITQEKTYIDTVFKVNPEYDPNKKYIPRSQRKEWSAVGMFGKLIVYDNGTAQANDYVSVGDNGTAVKSDNGYRVLKRVSNNLIQILFR